MYIVKQKGEGETEFRISIIINYFKIYINWYIKFPILAYCVLHIHVFLVDVHVLVQVVHVHV